MSELLQYFITGISVGAIYALVALGFNIIYNATEVINFAQGEFLVLGAFFAATFLGLYIPATYVIGKMFFGYHLEIAVVTPTDYPWWVYIAAVAVSIVCVTAIGALMYITSIFPVKGANVLRLIMITIALAFIFQGLSMVTWGKYPVRYAGFSDDPAPTMDSIEIPRPQPEWVGRSLFVFNNQVHRLNLTSPIPDWATPSVKTYYKPKKHKTASIKFLGATIIPQYLWVLGVTLVIVIIMTFFFERTMLGKAMSACADNPLAASLVGINVNRMVMLSFALSAFLGAVGGLVFLGPIGVQYDSGPLNAIKGFAAAVLGGLGSFWGAVVGGCLLGLVEAFWKGYLGSTYAEASAMLVLLAVLFFRPSGLFGSVEAAKIKKF
ncbi:MAG: branched-chain amino acid ABC transporter permease [Proteobacteria bacterium]|nr:branched-chain amino acid ABC transporter permease [Pseudomonadota bacterium]MBU1741341.1 branched-chain amino acid ABC transporter permease [Pseudomonadota bacterium]